MKRLIAAGIDFMISYVLSVIVYCIMISIWKMLRIIRNVDMENCSWLLVILLFFISYIFTNVVYSIFFDCIFHGNTLGKKIVGYKICEKENKKNKKWILKHALSRTVASMLYVIEALYYIGTYKMLYDKILE